MSKATDTTAREIENVNYFNDWAKEYDRGRITKWFQYTQDLAISVMTLRQDSKVLDVGCGTGFAVLRLGSILPEGRACGIDLSPEMVRQANAKVTDGLKERVEFRQAHAEEIPYPSDTFDVVLCTNSFHHYPHPLRALGEMRRVLRPGGQVVIFENAPDLSWYTWAWDKVLRIVETGHVRYYYSKEMGEMLCHAGFQDVKLCCLRNEFMKHGKLFASIQVWSGVEPQSGPSRMPASTLNHLEESK